MRVDLGAKVTPRARVRVLRARSIDRNASKRAAPRTTKMAPGSADINFDEFQAIRRRKAQDDEEDEDQKEEPATLPEEEEEPDGLAERAGAFAELPEVQLLLCVAILADVAGAALTAARDDGAPAFLVRAAAAFPGFVNFLYAFELLALATAFKLRMLTHPGLLLDVGIVSARHRRPLVYWRVDGVFGAALWPWSTRLQRSGIRQSGYAATA